MSNLNLSFIRGYLEAFTELNTPATDISFEYSLNQITDINNPFEGVSNVKISEIVDWEKEVTSIIHKWLFNFIDEYNINLSGMLVNEPDSKQGIATNICSLLKQSLNPKRVYYASSLELSPGRWDNIVFTKSNTHYLLSFSQTD